MGTVDNPISRRLLIWGMPIVVLLVVLDAAYATIRGGAALYGARSSLLRAVDHLHDGDAEGARSEFSSAEADLSIANSAFAHPGYWLLERVPMLGRDARAAHILANAADGLAASGGDAVDAAEDLGTGEGGLGSSLLQDGRVRLGRLEAATGPLDPLLEQVREADAILSEAPRPNLEVVRDAVLLARERVRGAREALERGRAVTGVANELFGGEGRKRYLLSFQAPSEARGSGGLFGLFAVLDVRNGAIDIGRISKPPKPLLAAAEPQITPVEAPDWFVDKYAAEASLWNSSEVNLSPHFPTVGEALLKMYEQVRDVELDGVLALDPHALAELLDATGPVDTPDLGPITDENAAKVIMHDSYVKVSATQQGRNLSVLLDEFFRRLRAGDVAGPEFVTGVADAAARGRLKFYVRDESSAEALRTARADGDFTALGPLQQFVWHNSDSISKVDWFLHRSIETVVQLEADGSAVVKTRILLDNRAPDGPVSLLLGGQAEGYRPGENRMRLDVLLPVGARLTSFKEGETELEVAVADEAGYPSAWLRLIMGPKSQRLFELTYEVPDALDPESGNTAEFTLYPHAAVRADEYLLTIYAPDGHRVRTSGTFDEPAEFVQITGRLEEATTLEVELVD